jgi:nicotinate phosphoribosyltransferase
MTGQRLDPLTSPLLTDLYELNMVSAYFDTGMTGEAVFELFFRKLPARRNFLLAAGLGTVLDFLEGLRFGEAELAWLRASRRFSEAVIERLAALRFTGDVDAMPEGTVFFPDEPILRVSAPLPEAQLIETRLINLLHVQTVVASKAARMVLAAPGKTLVDFGLRRAHGAEAGLLAARAAWLAGFAATASVPAEPLYGIPITGTMAHAFVQAHDSETEAFRSFARTRPKDVVLLIDTYDTEVAAHKVVALAPELKGQGVEVRGVRLDSGDLDALSRRVRAILDSGGLQQVRIIASGGLDEDKLARLIGDGAPIDGFGIGTSLTTAEDAPALDCCYKLQAYDSRARRKRSTGKATWPGAKQVFRRLDAQGRMAGDVIALAESVVEGRPLLVPAMRRGRRLLDLPDLNAARAHAAAELERLPPALRRLDPAPPYPVEIAPALRELAEQVDREAGAAS